MTKQTPLKTGTVAPAFELPDTPMDSVALSDFRGLVTVLVFYPADFNPESSKELSLFNEVLPEFRRHDAFVLGISVDNIWSHMAFTQDRNLHFPLLADFEPKGAVARAYGVYQAKAGEAARGLYVISPDQRVAWSYIAPPGVQPGVDGVLAAIEAIDTPSVRATGTLPTKK